MIHLLKLSLAVVSVICATGSVRAWDLGVVTSTQIQLFSNKTLNKTIAARLQSMIAIAYDPIRKDIFVSDSNQKGGSIFRMKTTGPTAYGVFEPIVAKQNASVQGMAFDHHTSTLYWTTGISHTINYVHVPVNVTKDPPRGKVLFKFGKEIPHGIAIDSCRGYLYWTNCYHLNASIERSRLNGSDREVILNQDLFQPLAIAIDVKNNMIYWSQQREGIYFSIESSNSTGNSRNTLILGTHHEPFAIALDDKDVYWSDWINHAVWSLPKNSFGGGATLNLVASFDPLITPMGLITPSGNTTLVNNTICQVERIIDDADVPTTDSNLYQVLRDLCKNDGVLHSNGSCVCAPGFVGDYCQTSACDGYCATGTCELDGDGRPTCKCPMTSYGERCDRELCAGRCLNGGSCALDGTGRPRCECPAGYSGDACEFKASALGGLCLVYCQHASPAAKSQQSSICRCDQYDNRQFEYSEMPMLNHSSCKVSRSMVAVIAILAVFVASLGTITMALARKVRMLGRRPRINKRFVVNKSITPLTCRPPQQQNHQCEITIENCCNMNICETPCFEPDFQSPKMVGGGLMSSLARKSKKEDKANLLSSTDMSSEDEKPLY